MQRIWIKPFPKESIIVFMKQNNDFVGCIEIDGIGKFAVQAKGPCNQSLSEPLMSYFKKYAGMINLSLERCDDVYDDYDDYYMDDYHELELDADGNVIHI